MYPTLEVRWFYQEEIPAAVQEWFGQCGGLPEGQLERVDRYLRLPGVEFLGIKLREGAIEIKQRQSQYGVIRFHRRVSGLLEGWCKWSFVLAGVAADSTSEVPAWSAVQKSRRLCRFKVLDDLKPVIVQPGEMPERGCDLELTRISCGRQRWWTLALESYGDRAALLETLARVASHVFSNDLAPVLEAAASYSYPRWLDLVDPGQGQKAEREPS